MRRRIRARRSPDARRLSTSQYAAALERHGVSAHSPYGARSPTSRALPSSGGQPRAAGLLPEVMLHDVRLGDAKATVRFWRDANGESHGEVVESRGTFRLVQQPPPESISVHMGDRLRALFDTV